MLMRIIMIRSGISMSVVLSLAMTTSAHAASKQDEHRIELNFGGHSSFLTLKPSVPTPQIQTINPETLGKLETSNGKTWTTISPKSTSSDETITTFKGLNANGIKLAIINNPHLNSNLNKPSNLTILINQASSPMIIGDLEVLGKRSDLVLVSPSGITCDSCSFKNVGRVTFVGGTYDTRNKKVKATSYVAIKNKGLTTSGADIVDIIAANIDISAPINTLDKVSMTGDGSYTIDPKGNKTAAQTNVMLIAGDNTVNYIDHDIFVEKGTSNLNSLTIKKPILASGVFIHNNGSIYFPLINREKYEPSISTLSDIKVLSQLSGSPVLSQGHIKISSFSDIVMEDAWVASESSVNIEARNINIRPSSSFKHESIIADNTKIIAAHSILNLGLISSNDISIAALDYRNKGGELMAKNDIFIDTQGNMINSHSGLIVGSNIAINSKNTIENGITTPWKCEIPKLFDSPKWGQGNIHIPKDKIDLGLGTGLILNSNAYQCSLLQRKYHKKEDRQAHILGFSVALNANKIINSNPKMDIFSSLEDYKSRHIRNENRNHNDDLITIGDSSDVSIIAENNLNIKSTTEIRNGSSSIEVLNGNLSIETAQIINERYYIASKTHIENVPWESPTPINETCKNQREKLSTYKVFFGETATPIVFENVNFIKHHIYMFFENDNILAENMVAKYLEHINLHTKGCDKYLTPYYPNKTITIQKKEQYLTAISPVPRILVGNNLFIQSHNNQPAKLYNEAGNIEVLGHFSGALSELKNLGILLQKSKIESTTTQHYQNYCSRRVFGRCIKRKSKHWTTTSEKLLSQENTDQVPALFYLHQGSLSVRGVNNGIVNSDGIIQTGNITYGKL
ncbi:TPA: filamentous hemagglutinin N-terminal domain-containing protein [Vibrio vulnificus]|nr:filamentous hemagglutinin N-terminal domain-containing protein [Vibrio vulnificus]HAS8444368.1 filamentous hemagglutinin N-terminal domain-containing protein [Vibrio vulnificus]HAS8453333.1 filamentous hemagglutinin N-terminal domain-containing protein [Vibrio vulnificus]HAT8517091.1 filamentous hemagglutinin N-terminal domain-containing protein [Vibrio vulnificus]